MSTLDYKPMYVTIREKCDLAATYAEDGAYTSAARVLREVAELTARHAERVRRPANGFVA